MNAPNEIDTSYPLPAIDSGFVAEAQSNPVREKSFRFALMIVGLCRELQADREYVVAFLVKFELCFFNKHCCLK